MKLYQLSGTTNCLCSIYTQLPYSGFLSREKTFANFTFLWRFVKVFSAKIYFQPIRYRASGRGALGYHKFGKVFFAKIYFQPIRYRASGRGALGYRKFGKVFFAKIYFQTIRYRARGRGALGYRKFGKVFSAKIYFQTIREVFSRERNPLYGMA